MSCPSIDDLAALVSGLLDDAAIRGLEPHLADCTTCRSVVVALATDRRGPRVDAEGIARATVGAESADPPDEPPRWPVAGESVGRYRVRRLLGAGAMGRVYHAHDPELGRDVAIKLAGVTPGQPGAPVPRAEAQAMARLRHPNVVQVFDVGQWRGAVFVAMELVDGTTFRAWQEAPRGWRAIVEVMAAAARGLAAAHAEGLIHRDFKPDNLLIGRRGEVCVSDFGLALRAGAPADAAGTPAYMAPEARGAAPDPRSDQYSFFVTLHEALHGVRPPAVSADRRVPGWLRRMCARGLSAEAARRFGSMAAVAAALERGRGRARRAAWAAAIVAIGGVTLGAAWSAARAPAREPCADAAVLPADTWSLPRRAQLAVALARAPGSDAADTIARMDLRLTAWRAPWGDARRTACLAVARAPWGTAPTERLRLACLDDTAGRVRAVIDRLTAGPADAGERALEAMAAATDLTPCLGARPELAPWSDSTARPALAARLRAELAEAFATASTGAYEDGARRARGVADAARAERAPAIEAEAACLAGTAALSQGALREGREALERCAVTAEAAGHDRARAGAYLGLCRIAGITHALDDADRLLGQARALVERLADPGLAILVDDAGGRIARSRGQLDRAVELADAALARCEATAACAGSLRLGYLLEFDGVVHSDRGHDALATARWERATVVREQQLGARNPALISPLSLRAEAAIAAHRDGEALPLLERAAAIARAMREPTPPAVSAIAQLASLHARAGQRRAARGELDQAIAIYAARFPDDASTYAELLRLRASVRGADDAPGALADLQDARARLEGRPAPEDLDLAGVLDEEAATLLTLGRRAEARAAYTRALALRLRLGGPPEPIAAERAALAAGAARAR